MKLLNYLMTCKILFYVIKEEQNMSFENFWETNLVKVLNLDKVLSTNEKFTTLLVNSR